MSDNAGFEIVGRRAPREHAALSKGRKEKRPVAAAAILALICLGCLFCSLIQTHDPSYMDLANSSVAPCREFWFGTDTMGRDIFSMTWSGGRVSLLIGILSAAISFLTAVVVGAVSGCAPVWADELLMRLTDILLSVPSLLLVTFLQAMLGEAGIVSLSLVIGLTGWMSMAKVIRTQVKQIRNSEYVLAARCMGGSFFHILFRHLLPNFISSVMFMVVMNVRSAIVAESTLSFMGIGLPLSVISWGSMLSLAEKALLSGAGWIILIPGLFLTVTLVCITSLGDYLRRQMNRGERTL